MNGYLWRIEIVEPYDQMLVDRTNNLTVGTTDPLTHTVYLSSSLKGDFLLKVLIHELGHCALVSFGLLDEVHKMVKREYWIEAEERLCNFIADYGFKIFSIAYSVLGNNAWICIPREFEKLYAA